MRHRSFASIFVGFVLFGIANTGGTGILKSEAAYAQGVPVAELTPGVRVLSSHPRLLLDTQIETPARNDNAVTLPEKQAGDTIRFQLFAPAAGGTQIQGYTIELSLRGKTFGRYIDDVAGADLDGNALLSRVSVTGNPTLSMLSLSAVTVPSSGYLGQATLSVSRALTSSDVLAVQLASTADAGGVQNLDVSNASLSFARAAACPGDFDGDGMVSLADFLTFAGAFGTRSGAANYDDGADMDGNGSVDLSDFLAFAGVFGTTCETSPPPPPPPPTAPVGSDREALVALYNATNGDNWRVNTNWLSDKPLGEWYGVTTDAGGRVTRLALYAVATGRGDTVGIGEGSGTYVGNRLTGSIPAALGSLSNLTSLSFSLNQLTGPIPEELGSLSHLTALFLNGNRLTGGIPAELGSLSNLQYLSLYDNRLTGTVPEELGSLSHLTTLFLSGNRLTGGIPSALGNLTFLTQLWLNDNRLTGAVPEELGGLTNLRVLFLHNNAGLTGPFPTSFTGLGNLEDMLAHGTGLCMPADEAFETWWEYQISNEKRAVSCAVPDERAALVALYNATDGTNWVFNTNWLSDKPMGEWYGVTTGTTGRVTHLRLFTYDSNKPIGSTGTVSGNGLAGPLPAALGRLTNLARLHLPSNRLKGGIPWELGGMTRLGELRLENNPDLEGPLPGSFTALGALERLILDNTSLCAPTDAAFQAWFRGVAYKSGVTDCRRGIGRGSVAGDRAALVALYNATDGTNWTNKTNWLSDKPLGEWYGVITDVDGRVTRLTLSNNQLSGSIPSALGNLSNLTELYLNSNQLTGSIPSSLGSLSNLTELHLNLNQLTGSIPSSLGNLSNLNRLWLNNNQLTGSIPSALGNLSNLTATNLNSNQLTGSIPSALGNLSSLTGIALGHNQLTGSVPSALGSLSKLTNINLAGNSGLTGALPGSFTGLDKLNWLDLSGTGLCAPTDAAFQAWLQGITTRQGVVNCS